MHTTELNKPSFGITPKTFNAVDVGLIYDELIFTMIDPKLFSIPDINQAIVASPAIGIDDAVQADLSSNHLLQRGLRAVGNNRGVDAAIAPEDTKDNGFPVCSSPSFSFDATSAKEGFIDFNFPTEWGFGLTKLEPDAPEWL